MDGQLTSDLFSLDNASALLEAASCTSLPDHRFLECISRGKNVEVWRVELPDGRRRLARFVHGFASPELQARWEALIGQGSGVHPALLRCEIVQSEPGRVVLLTEVIEKTLWDRFEECRKQGLIGIPRWELLGLLPAIADALDTLYDSSRVQHLGLAPRGLLWDGSHLFLSEVGLAQCLGEVPTGVRPRPKLRLHYPYSSPEYVIDNSPAPSSDQFSMALIFAEMLTGHHPFGSLSRERASRERQQWRPDLDLLPGPYRDIITRALSFDPSRRYRSCTALVKALQAATQRMESEDVRPVAFLPPVMYVPGGKLSDPQLQVPAPRRDLQLPSAEDLVGELLGNAGGGVRVREYQQIRYLQWPGEMIQHRCGAHLPPGVASRKLDGFCARWKARPIRSEDKHYLFHIATPRDFWQLCTGRQVGIQVELRMSEPNFAARHFTEVHVTLRPVGCQPRQAVEILELLGPVLLESLRSYLQAAPDLRTQERLEYSQPLQVAPVLRDRSLGGVLTCQAKDISLGGIGMYVPQKPLTQDLYINIVNQADASELALLAKVVRVKAHSAGWYEIGARFASASPCL